MTPKTTLTARVSPDTLAGIDSAAQAAGVNRSQLVDRILADWMRAQGEAGRQRWANVHELLDRAIEALDQAASRPLDTWQEDMIAAVRWLINATAEIDDA